MRHKAIGNKGGDGGKEDIAREGDGRENIMEGKER